MAKHKAILSMPPDKVEALKSLIKLGHPDTYLAKKIQNDWGLLKDIGQSTLVKYVNRFKHDEVHVTIVKEVLQTPVGKDIVEVAKKINALDELIELIELQKKRLQKVLLTETNVHNALLDQTTEAIRDLTMMIDKLGKLQLETGVIKRAPKVIQGTVNNPDGSITDFTVTEEDQHIIEMFKEDALKYIEQPKSQ